MPASMRRPCGPVPNVKLRFLGCECESFRNQPTSSKQHKPTSCTTVTAAKLMQFPATAAACFVQLTGTSGTPIEAAVASSTGNPNVASFSLAVNHRFEAKCQNFDLDNLSVGMREEVALQVSRFAGLSCKFAIKLGLSDVFLPKRFRKILLSIFTADCSRGVSSERRSKLLQTYS